MNSFVVSSTLLQITHILPQPIYILLKNTEILQFLTLVMGRSCSETLEFPSLFLNTGIAGPS
jgi:hypothetical protein